MAYEHKEGQGSLFKNDKQNDRQPDLKGTIMIKGVLYNVSGWNRTSQGGREYISLQAEEKSNENRYQRPAQPAPSYQPTTSYQPAPSYQPPVAPPPTMDDMPSFVEDDGDLPF